METRYVGLPTYAKINRIWENTPRPPLVQLLPELATDSNFNAFNFGATAPGARQNKIIAEICRI